MKTGNVQLAALVRAARLRAFFCRHGEIEAQCARCLLDLRYGSVNSRIRRIMEAT